MLNAVVFDPQVVMTDKKLDELSRAQKLSQTPVSWNKKENDKKMNDGGTVMSEADVIKDGGGGGGAGSELFAALNDSE